jgi:hypothetical protein
MFGDAQKCLERKFFCHEKKTRIKLQRGGEVKK